MMAATDLNFKFWACAETGFVINYLDKDDIDINIEMFILYMMPGTKYVCVYSSVKI